jgi:Domain of unknown function (DUF3127)
MSYQIEGTIHKIFESERKTEKFTVRNFILQFMDGEYKQHGIFQVTNDRCDTLDNYSAGDKVTVHFDLRGRLWNDKAFNTLNAWKLEGEAKTQAQPEPVSEPATVPDKKGDDLPF